MARLQPSGDRVVLGLALRRRGHLALGLLARVAGRRRGPSRARSGQDNFADYYVVHRHTSEEPSWTHSLELRLLAQTGIVGFLLFAVFLGGAIIAAVRARRGTNPMTRWIAGAALVPLVVWLVHGSVDWFWEMPTLSGPALGFLALAGSLRRRRDV